MSPGLQFEGDLNFYVSISVQLIVVGMVEGDFYRVLWKSVVLENESSLYIYETQLVCFQSQICGCRKYPLLTSRGR